MKTLLIVLLSLGSIVVIALLIAALFGIEVIDQVFEFFEGDDNED